MLEKREYLCRGGKIISFTLLGPWLRPSCNKKRLIGEKVNFVHIYIHEPHKDKKLKGRQLGFIYHTELKNGRAVWSFKGEEDNSQEGEKRKC